MLYKELYKESNELAKERFALVRERSMIYGQMMRFKNRV